MMRLGLALALSLVCAPAIAGPDRLSILLGSRHMGGAGFEQTNPGVFLTWERRVVDWSFGIYRNSYGRASVSLTAALPVARLKETELAIFAGLALYPGTGAQAASAHLGDVVPLAGLQLRHKHIFTQIIPLDGKPVQAVVSFGLTFPLTKGLSK